MTRRQIVLAAMAVLAAAAAPHSILRAVPASAFAEASADKPACEFTGVDRIVAVGDVHGAYDRFVGILRVTGLVDDRLRWSGGKTHLVQLGDVLDRGPDSRKTLDFLQRLTREAQSAGGRVHALLGNHEAMRLLGDFRYVAAGEYEAFTTPDSQSLRNRLLETRPAAERDAVLQTTPLGQIEMVRAFASDGDYGRSIRSLNAVVRINDLVFLHGGLSPAVAVQSCSSINETVRRELSTDAMLKQTRAEPKGTLSASAEGPLWYRGLAEESDAFAPEVDKILDAQHARAIVVGHTVQTSGRILARFSGKVFLIDTGMQPAYVSTGRASALEIRGDVFTAIYEDSQQVLRRNPGEYPMTRTPTSRRASGVAIAGVLAAAMLGWPLDARQTTQTGGSQTATVQNAATPAPEPWPDAKTLESRRVSAEGRRLFQTEEPLAFRLIANFKAVNGDLDPNSTKTYPATIEFVDDAGTTHSIALQIRPRGHSRRQVCTHPPLRLEFPKDQTKGTIFDGHGALKLGTHCKPELDDYVLREYATYRIYNLLTPRSFRARLARATYVDVKTRAVIETRNAMFLEDDDDVAKRMSGRIDETEKLRFAQFDDDTLTLMMVFEYFIGNTDLSLFAPHNTNVVITPQGVRYPVPYDFDYAGVVNAIYAVPGRGLGLVTVRTRLYRGPCKAPSQLAPVFDRLRNVRDRVMAIYDALPGLKPAYRKEAGDYLGKFFTAIDSPIEVKKAFIDGCNGRPYV